MTKLKNAIEKLIPMTLGSFILFVIIVYLMVIVGKTVWTNYRSNQEIAQQQQSLLGLQEEISNTQNQIAYLKTRSFKEKQARAKLGYVAQGETAVSVPLDDNSMAPGDVQAPTPPITVKLPNYYLWWDYFSS